MTTKEIIELSNKFIEKQIESGSTDQEILDQLEAMAESGEHTARMMLNYLYSDMSEEEKKQLKKLKKNK